MFVKKQIKTVYRSQQALMATSIQHVVLLRPFDLDPCVVFSVPSLKLHLDFFTLKRLVELSINFSAYLHFILHTLCSCCPFRSVTMTTGGSKTNRPVLSLSPSVGFELTKECKKNWCVSIHAHVRAYTHDVHGADHQYIVCVCVCV